jgi:hypothetical protein
MLMDIMARLKTESESTSGPGGSDTFYKYFELGLIEKRKCETGLVHDNILYNLVLDLPSYPTVQEGVKRFFKTNRL